MCCSFTSDFGEAIAPTVLKIDNMPARICSNGGGCFTIILPYSSSTIPKYSSQANANARLRFVLRNLRRNFHLPLLIPMQYRHCDRLLRVLLDVIRDRQRADHLPAIDSDDHVALFQAGALRRAVLEDRIDFRIARIELYRQDSFRRVPRSSVSGSPG